MGGGDLLNLLIERDTFPEDFTRFYVAEVRTPVLYWMERRLIIPLDGSSYRVVSQIRFHSS
jgi:mRNA-degrading endonuclease HigB of HigAB toxin-antitoxin module